MRVGSEQPFLFFPEGMDVRWRSYATVAEQAIGGRRALEGLGLPEGAGRSSGEPVVVAYAWAGGVAGADGVAADLAIRSGGWTAAPVPVPAVGPSPAGSAGPPPLRPPEHRARLLLPWEADPVAAQGSEGRDGTGSGPLVARLPAAARELGRRPSRDRSGDLPPRPGGVLVRESAARGEQPGGPWRVVGSEALRQAAEDLAAVLDCGVPGARTRTVQSAGRPVVVAWLDPSLVGGRVLLEWAIMARAALYLEPDPRILGGAAAWVRPTVVAGDAGALAAVAAEIRRQDAGRSRLTRRFRGSGPHLPFGRLRWVVLVGAAELAEEDRALFTDRGVALVRPELRTESALSSF